jgi:hypothetical protein
MSSELTFSGLGPPSCTSCFVPNICLSKLSTIARSDNLESDMLRYYYSRLLSLSYYFQTGLPRRCVGFLRSQDRNRTCECFTIKSAISCYLNLGRCHVTITPPDYIYSFSLPCIVILTPKNVKKIITQINILTIFI